MRKSVYDWAYGNRGPVNINCFEMLLIAATLAGLFYFFFIM